MSDLPAREPCENEDCDLCNPLPRWKISTVTVRRIRHEREIKAATLEEAMKVYVEGTAWPATYDEVTLEVLEISAPKAVSAPSNAEDVDRLHICFNRPGANIELTQEQVDALLEPE